MKIPTAQQIEILKSAELSGGECDTSSSDKCEMCQFMQDLHEDTKNSLGNMPGETDLLLLTIISNDPLLGPLVAMTHEMMMTPMMTTMRAVLYMGMKLGRAQATEELTMLNTNFVN